MNFVVTNSKYFAALPLEIIDLQGAGPYSETRDVSGGNRIYILPFIAEWASEI